MRLACAAAAISVYLSCPPAIAAGYADDACATRLIETAADVSVSNGRRYATRSVYRSKHEAAIDFIDGGTTTLAVEGPFGWTRNDSGATPGGEQEKGFALGHQFHALLLHFDDIIDDAHPADAIAFRGGLADGRSGLSPYGGTAHLILGPEPERPLGMKFEPPGHGPVEIVFSDWRRRGGRDLPWLVTIHDGDDVYTYKYSSISVHERSPLRFYEEAGDTGLDAVDIYRLHRRILAAHCLGDAEMMARLMTPEGIVANRGELFLSTRNELLSNITGLFERLDYRSYEDTAVPLVEVSPAGDFGWIGVKVRASGIEKTNGEPFRSEWAWILLARKIDGEWLGAGNASNQPPT